jgi:hypothetical protein
MLEEIDEYARMNSIRIIVNSSYRPKEDLVSRKVVKPASRSNHFAGYAIDFNVRYQRRTYFSHELKRSNLKNLPTPIQGFIQKIRDDKELRWGGDFDDPIHIDSPLNIDDPGLWNEYVNSCFEEYSTAIPKWKIWKK